MIVSDIVDDKGIFYYKVSWPPIIVHFYAAAGTISDVAGYGRGSNGDSAVGRPDPAAPTFIVRRIPASDGEVF